MFIAAVAMIATVFFPLWEKADSQTDATEREYMIMSAFELRYERHHTETGEIVLLGSKNVMVLSIGAFLAAAIMLFSIFQYDNRLLQVKLNALFSVIVAATVIGIVWFSMKSNDWIEPQRQGQFRFGFFLPIVAMFNNFLANRFIRKDEKLVSSANRIR